MQTRRPWLRRASVTAVSTAALVAMAAPADAATTSRAFTTAPTSATASAAADVDYGTWQKDCQAVMDHEAGRETGHRLRHRQHDAGDGLRLQLPATGQQARPGGRQIRAGARRRPVLRHRPAGHHRLVHPVQPEADRLPGLGALRPQLHRPVQERRRLQNGPARRYRAQGLHDHREHRQQRHRPLGRPRRADVQVAGLRRAAVVGSGRPGRGGRGCPPPAPSHWVVTLRRPCSGSGPCHRPPARSAGRPGEAPSPRRGR